MSDSTNTRSVDAASEPFLRRAGFFGHGCFEIPIAKVSTVTSPITESGFGYCAGLTLSIADDVKNSTLFSVETAGTISDGRLFPSTKGPGTTYGRTHTSYVSVGGGRASRLYPYINDAGDVAIALSLKNIPFVGIGSSSAGTQSAWTVDVRTAYSAELEILLADRWSLWVGPGILSGTQYGGDGSEFSNAKISFMLMLRIGPRDASVTSSEEEADVELGGLAMLSALWAISQGTVQGILMNKTLADPLEALKKYGISTTGNGAGPTQNAPLLDGVSTLLGGLASLSPTLHTSNIWFWLLTGLRVAGGAASAASGGTSGMAKGIGGDISTALRLGIYAAEGIHTPALRNALPGDDEAKHREVRYREACANIALGALYTLLASIGAAVGNDVLTQSFNDANVNLALTPDPTGYGVSHTEVSYIGYGLVWGNEDGGTAGVRITQRWGEFPLKNFNLVSSVELLSPQLRMDNLFNHANQSSPYNDIQVPTVINVMPIGFEWWPSKYTPITFGPATKRVFGGGENATAGLGLMTMFGLSFPVGKNISLTPWIGWNIFKIFPKGMQNELLFGIGGQFGPTQ